MRITDEQYRKGTIFSNPRGHNLQIILKWYLRKDDPGFSIVCIFQDTVSGEFLVGRDEGCCCPSPFENDYSKERLLPLSPQIYKVFSYKTMEEFVENLRMQNVPLLTLCEFIEAMKKVEPTC